MTIVLDRFDTWGGFLAQVRDGKRVWESQTSQAPASQWNGGIEWGDSIDLMAHGWPEGRQKLHKAVTAMKHAQDRGRAARYAYDVAGVIPNVPRFIAGDPYNMRTPRKRLAASNPIIRVVISVSFSAVIRPDTIINRGAAILSIVDRLETDNVSVELVVTDGSESGNDQYHVVAPFKAAGEPLEIDRAAYALAHPAMLRRSIFALYEQHSKLERKFSGGYGHPYECPPAEREDAVYFGALSGNDRQWTGTPEQCLKHAESIFAAYFDRHGAAPADADADAK